MGVATCAGRLPAIHVARRIARQGTRRDGIAAMDAMGDACAIGHGAVGAEGDMPLACADDARRIGRASDARVVDACAAGRGALFPVHGSQPSRVALTPA